MMTATEKCVDYSTHQADLSACSCTLAERSNTDGHFATVFACYNSKHSYLDLFTLRLILPAIFIAIIFLLGHSKSGK
jgi:hypothetical protein